MPAEGNPTSEEVQQACQRPGPVVWDEPAFQGSLVLTRLIAVIEAEQTEKGKTEHNDRLIGVAAISREYRSVESPDQLSPDLMVEIEHFFISYNHLAGKEFRPVGRAGADHLPPSTDGHD